MSSDNLAAVLADLETRIRFHASWHRICMLAYVIPAVIAAAASVLATAFAAHGLANTAAILSGTTTVGLLIEKTLMLREKWRLHLSVRTSLEMLKLRAQTGRMTPEKVMDELDGLLRNYASALPIAQREHDEYAKPAGAAGK
jgi:hypothetical protein